MRFIELPLSAQAAYSELAEQTRAFETAHALAGLSGSFQRLERKENAYWYFAFRDIEGKVRLSYVGPDDERVRALVERHRASRVTKPLAPQAKAAIALGASPVPPKHFRIVKRLADHGFFRAGGILVGTHAFVAYGNMLGVRWAHGATTLDVDFAHAGRNVSVALPADLEIDVHGALESLEIGLLPITQLAGGAGAEYRNPRDPELRLDFLTSETRSGQPVVMPQLNLALQPLKFMEFSLEGTVQACIFAASGACTVNVPAPERYAVHKLIIQGERTISERAKSRKDLLQAASVAGYLRSHGEARRFNASWRDAIKHGKGWRTRAMAGKKALLAIAPDLDDPKLWRE